MSQDASGPAGLPDAADLMSLLDGLPVMMTATEGPELRLVALSASVQALSKRADWLGRPFDEVYPELVTQGVVDLLAEVYRTGLPFTAPEWRVELAGPDGEVGEVVIQWTMVPWRGPGDTVRGVISIAQDVTAQASARRAAEQRAAEVGQRYEHVLDVVSQLQQALLPATLPVLPGMEIAARYLVAGAEQSAGGDWFDVRPLPDGRVGLVVGDVVGHGVTAAAVMSQLRAVLAHALDRTGDPVAAVAELDAFAATVPGARSATVAVAVLDRAAGTLDLVTRGHPAPLFVDADGRARQLLGSGGGPLGSGPGGPAQRTEMAETEVLVLFSDGLVERPDRPYTAGLDELTRLTETATAGQLWPTGTAPAAVDRICSDAVEMLTRRGHDDDVTVLAVQLRPVLPPLRARIPATEEDLPRAREAVRDWLTALGAEPGDRLALELAVGEAVDNAVEHGFGYLPRGLVVFFLELRPDGSVAVHVTDDGMWQDRPVGAPGRGTGLRLIGDLSQDLEVDGHPTGTTVTFTRALTRPVTTTPAASDPRTALPPAGGRYASRLGGEPTRLRLSGPVDATSVDRLRADLAEHSRGGTRPLVVDLTEVSHLTSVGVAALADLLAADHETPSTLVAPTGSTAAFVLDLVGLPRSPEHPDQPLTR